MSLRGMGRPVLDLGVAEVERVEQGVVSSEERCVGAPVLLEREALPGLGLPGGLEVGVHISTAERIDGLLRVADQDQAGYTVSERPLDHLPLDGVGVLELVHEHHPVTLAQPAARHVASLFVRKCRKKTVEKAVVGQEIGIEKAPLEISANALRQPPAQAGWAGVLHVGLGVKHSAGVVDRPERKFQRLLAPERWYRRPEGVADEQVV